MQAHAGPQQLALPDPKNLRILVVDSKSVSRQTTTQLLRECSYQVTAVKTAREGLQLLIEAEHGAAYDLVLKEHEPPGANACRLLKRMAKTEGLTRTPVVVVSTQDERETVMSCLSLGAIDYLIKPLRQNELRHIWTRVWWWRKSQGLHPGAPPSIVLHMGGRHYGAYRGPGGIGANRQYEDTSSDSKQTKCQDEEEPTSKEGSAPDNGNGHGSNGNGSNGSKEGNGTSRVDAKPHCDGKDTAHGSNGNGHGSNNGNGHGSNGNGSNGSSDNKNGGNGNSATKGDGNGHGSNGNGASTTLAVDRHYQALVNTAEGKLPPNLLVGGHDSLPGANKGGAGRSSAFAQYTGPSTSSRKRAATSEAVPPGDRDRDCDAPDREREDGGAGGSGGSGVPGGNGEGQVTGGASGQPLSRSKNSVQRDRAAMLRGSGASGHGVSEETLYAAAGGISGAGGSGALQSGGSNAAAHQHLHAHVQQPTVSGERPNSQGFSPHHYGSLAGHPASGSGSRSQQGGQGAMGAAGWMAMPPHPHSHHLGMPPGLPPALQAMFPAMQGLPPAHLLSRMPHPGMRFGPGAPAGSSHNSNPQGSAPSDQGQVQAMFPFPPPELAALAAASEAHAQHAARNAHGHPHGPPHGLGPLGNLVLGSEGAAGGGNGVPPGGVQVHPPTSSATNLNAMFLNQLLANGVTLQAFLGQAGPMPVPPLPGSRAPTHSGAGAPNLPLHHQHQQAVAAVAAAAAGWRPPQFNPAAMAAAAAAAAAAGVNPFPPAASGAGSADLAAAGAARDMATAAMLAAGGMPDLDAAEAAAAAAAADAAGPGGAGRPALPGLPEPKRRRALALDKYRKKRKNLRFSKTIRYESRKQLAQQRPRVRGQFIKHGPLGSGVGDLDRDALDRELHMEAGEERAVDGGGGGRAGRGEHGAGRLVDDGVTGGTASNGAKSGTGGAGGAAAGMEDGGADEEVQTNSRGYYEDEDYAAGEAEEDETEEEDMECGIDGELGSMPLALPLHGAMAMALGPMGQLASLPLGLASLPLALMQQQQQPAEQEESQRRHGAPNCADDQDVEMQDTAAPQQLPESTTPPGGTGGSTDGPVASSDHAAASAAATGAAAGSAKAGGSAAVGEVQQQPAAAAAGGTVRGAAGGGASSQPRVGAMGSGGGSLGVPQPMNEEAAVVRSLVGLREAAVASRGRVSADPDGAPQLLQELKAARSVGSQGSLSRDRGHSRGHSHGHSHSHGQTRQKQHELQSHSHGGGQAHGTLSHGHSRPLSMLRPATSTGEPPGGQAPMQHGQAAAPPSQLTTTQLPQALPQGPAAAGQQQAGTSAQGGGGAGGGALPAGPTGGGTQVASSLGAAGAHPAGSGPRVTHAGHTGRDSQQAGQHAAGGVGGSGRASGLHGADRDAHEGREAHRERDREYDRDRDREGRDREGAADNGAGSGKNGSDSGSNSPDENGGNGRGVGGSSSGRAKGAAEKGGHSGHKGGGAHGHMHR